MIGPYHTTLLKAHVAHARVVVTGPEDNALAILLLLSRNLAFSYKQDHYSPTL